MRLRALFLVFWVGITAFVSVADARWTVMVYMAADNELDVFSVGNLVEMTFASPSSSYGGEYDLYVLIDRGEHYTDDWDFSGVPDFTTAALLTIVDRKIYKTLDLGEINSENTVYIEKLLDYGYARSSSNYLLILWDHGGAYAGFGVDENPGLGRKRVIPMNSITDAIARSSKRNGKQLSMIVFDACIMANLEVVSDLSSVTRYVLASERNIPGDGLDYSSLAVLRTNPSMSAFDLANRFINDYVDRSEEEPIPGVPRTLSLLDATMAHQLQTQLAHLLTSMLHAPDGWLKLTTMLYGIRAKYPDESDKTLGLFSVGELIVETARAFPMVSTQQAHNAFRAIIVKLKSEFGLQGSSGLSVYLNDPLQDDEVYSRYLQYTANFRNITEWQNALANLNRITMERFTASPKLKFARNLTVEYEGIASSGESSIVISAKLADDTYQWTDVNAFVSLVIEDIPIPVGKVPLQRIEQAGGDREYRGAWNGHIRFMRFIDGSVMPIYSAPRAFLRTDGTGWIEGECLPFAYDWVGWYEEQLLGTEICYLTETGEGIDGTLYRTLPSPFVTYYSEAGRPGLFPELFKGVYYPSFPTLPHLSTQYTNSELILISSTDLAIIVSNDDPTMHISTKSLEELALGMDGSVSLLFQVAASQLQGHRTWQTLQMPLQRLFVQEEDSGSDPGPTSMDPTSMDESSNSDALTGALIAFVVLFLVSTAFAVLFARLYFTEKKGRVQGHPIPLQDDQQALTAAFDHPGQLQEEQ